MVTGKRSTLIRQRAAAGYRAIVPDLRGPRRSHQFSQPYEAGQPERSSTRWASAAECSRTAYRPRTIDVATKAALAVGCFAAKFRVDVPGEGPRRVDADVASGVADGQHVEVRGRNIQRSVLDGDLDIHPLTRPQLARGSMAFGDVRRMPDLPALDRVSTSRTGVGRA